MAVVLLLLYLIAKTERRALKPSGSKTSALGVRWTARMETTAPAGPGARSVEITAVRKNRRRFLERRRRGRIHCSTSTLGR